jgi:hypothetical protein
MVFLNQYFDKNRGYAVKYVQQMYFAGHDASLCVAAVFCLWLCIIVWLCEKRLLLCLEGLQNKGKGGKVTKFWIGNVAVRNILGNLSLIRDIFQYQNGIMRIIT